MTTEGMQFETPQQRLSDEVVTAVESAATQETLVGVVDQFERFKEDTRAATLRTDQRLADTQLLQGEGIPVHPGKFVDGIAEYFTPLSVGVVQMERSVVMEDLLPLDGSQQAQTTSYRFGGDVSILVDSMSRVDTGHPTWVRVTAVREPSSSSAPSRLTQ